MKRIISLLFIVGILITAYAAWNIFGPTVSAPEEKYFYVKTGATYEEVKKMLLDRGIISGGFFFEKIADRVKYSANVKPGRYEIRDGSSLVNLVRMLKSGRQAPVRLVINKLRTKEDLASKIGRNFESDSAEVMRFLTSNDSLAEYKMDTNTVMTTVIPDTYELFWNSSFHKIFTRLKNERDNFWGEDRTRKASVKKLTPAQVYTMASIVEEETNKQDDKGLIASVYINRINKGMKLEADPTVKYAMRNFGLKRILHGHLAYESAYNTYRNLGLPPGPICTPSGKTIDAVLDAPETDYIFFVAKPDFKGYSNFAATYTEHLVFARAYQKALDSLIISKRNAQQSQ